MASGRRVAFVPPAGAVSEFKVETAAFDAQQGHTAGATVNVTIKSGTNALKGEGYWYYRDDKLSKNDFFLEAAGSAEGGDELRPVRRLRRRADPEEPDVLLRRGRVALRRVPRARPVHGADREDAQRRLLRAARRPASSSTTRPPQCAAPTAASSASRSPATSSRPARISPIAREYMQYWPLPNQAGDDAAAEQLPEQQPAHRRLLFRSRSAATTASPSTQSLFVRYTRNDRQEARGNWAGEVNGIRPIGNFLYRVNDGVTGDHVWAISPQRAAQRARRLAAVPGAERAPARRGSSTRPRSASRPRRRRCSARRDYLPRFEIGGMSAIGENVGGTTVHSIYSFQPTFTRMSGRHTLRAGYDFRLYQETGAGPGRSAGQYDFANNYTRQLDNSSHRRHRPAVRGVPPRPADRRLDRAQRGPRELVAVPRALVPGRLAR